ncbi:MAG TPA: lysophospholipid acyltransferase family protein [Candidatus Dormibacteraeota bacterium]|nr:lysophospholipid acyltransferase family protein [Candidatus Dormibacteraeota bacterium]
MSQAPAGLPPLGLRIGLNTAAAAIRGLGELRYRLSDPVANATFALQRNRRRATIQNFREFFPGLTAKEARRLAARSYREYGRTSIDFLYVHHLARGRVFAELKSHGVEANLVAHQRQGRPGILVMMHHGSWDVPAAVASAKGIQLTSVMTDEGSAVISELVIWARREIGVTVVPMARSASVLLRRIRAGGWVALLTDIPGSSPAVEVEFLGRKTLFSAAPALLAARTGAPLVPATCVRRPQGGYLIEVHEPVAVEPDCAPAEALGRVIPVFEAAVRRWPEQWFPFREDLALDLSSS